jgi:hypothetical protein
MSNDSPLVPLALKPCVPARHFDLSKRFYLDVGFRIVHDSQKEAQLEMGECRFVLQNFCDGPGTQHSLLELLVTDVDAWWRHLLEQDLARRYDVRQPDLLALAGERSSILMHDPSGVVWHIKQGRDS